jgi:ribonucleoside-diphosphate reductase alpha chain
LVEQLKGIRCHSTLRQMNQKGIKVLSCPDAIGRVLEKVAKQFESSPKSVQPLRNLLPVGSPKSAGRDSGSIVLNGDCPECGAVMEHEGGCVICRGCGHSKCG